MTIREPEFSLLLARCINVRRCRLSAFESHVVIAHASLEYLVAMGCDDSPAAFGLEVDALQQGER